MHVDSQTWSLLAGCVIAAGALAFWVVERTRRSSRGTLNFGNDYSRILIDLRARWIADSVPKTRD